MYEDEIDLRPYIIGLIRKWKWIVFLTILMATIGFIFTRLSSDRYKAVAVALLTKQTSKLYLASQLPTTTEPTSNQSRTDTILSIAKSDTIAYQVWEAVKTKWPETSWTTLGAFKNSATFEINGDTLMVEAVSTNPELAELLANTWAQVLSDAVNLAYSGEQPLSLVQSQRESAQTDYETSQMALENFLQISQIEALEQKINNLSILSTGTTNDIQNLYDYYQNRKNEMLALGLQAEALKQQIELGNNSSASDFGDALAILLTRATYLNLHVNHVENDLSFKSDTREQQISTRASLASSVSIQLNDLEILRDNPKSHIADIENIISMAQSEQTKAEAAMQALSQTVLGGANSPTTDEIFTQLREAKAQLENEQATFTTLENDRDLALTAYQTLLAKETEIKNAPKSSNFMVVLSPAMLPESPESRGTLSKTGIGGLAGFFLSVIVTLANVWWKSANIFNSKDDKKSSKQGETEA